MAMEQTDLFDRAKAIKKRDEAIDAVQSGASDWVESAIAVVRDISTAAAEFTTDRVEYELARRDIPDPPEKRAMGAVMRIAARRGYVTKTDRTVPSVMPRNHRRPKAIWHSEIYR